jgi:hypothetical protein
MTRIADTDMHPCTIRPRILNNMSEIYIEKRTTFSIKGTRKTEYVHVEDKKKILLSHFLLKRGLNRSMTLT